MGDPFTLVLREVLATKVALPTRHGRSASGGGPWLSDGNGNHTEPCDGHVDYPDDSRPTTETASQDVSFIEQYRQISKTTIVPTQ